MKKLPFIFESRCEAGQVPAEISIRGIIGSSVDMETWTMTDTETEVLNELNQIPADKKIHVRINSPGGDHRMSLGVYNALRRRGNVETFNEGYACSGAILVLLAGDKIHCPPSSLAMFHMAATGDYGNRKDKQSVMEYLRTADETQAAILAPRLKKTKEDVMALLESGENWLSGDKMMELGLADDDSGEIDMDDAEARAFVCKQYKQIPNDLRARMIAQVTAATPPATQTQPQTLSMKKIIAALVAAGFQTSDDADESNVLGHVTALVNERNRLQAENTKHLDARKARVTAIVSQAITDKLVAETRREALITLGQANEEELTAQIADLRTLSSTRQPRGAAPARRTGETGADAEAQVADLQDQMNSRDCTAEARGALAMESLKARGLDQLFKKNTAVSGHN